MRMNLRQIEVFRTIMLTHSISGAAKLLNVSQPAVSRLISHTEQRLGLPLFERIKGRLYPTPEARRLFDEVNSVYQGVLRVNEIADDLIEHRGGYLRIGSSSNLSQSIMPAAIGTFCRQHPDVRIVLQTMSPAALIQALLTQQIELGVAYLPLSHPNLQAQLLYENRIVAVLPAAHTLARKRALRVDDLLKQPFIGYSSDIPFGQLIRQLMDTASAPLVPRVEVQQAHVACALVQAGVGIALADEQTMQGGSWPGIITRPVLPHIPAPVQAFHALYEPLSRAARAFLEVLKQR
ncbi:MAG: LysR family transcriptional regulator [Burkholderiaceae bacterium]